MGISRKLKRWFFENRDAHQTVAKNTAWLFFSQILSRAFRAVLVIYAARVLGATDWGAFAYALTLATFFTTFADFGLNATLTREIAKGESRREGYLATVFFIKIGLIALLFAVAFFGAPHIGKIAEATDLFKILILVFIFDAFRDFLNSFARATQRMELEAFLTSFTNASIAALGIGALLTFGTPQLLAGAYALGSGLGLGLAIFVLRRHLGQIFQAFKPPLIAPILRKAAPFGLLSILGVLMLNTDIVMVGWLIDAPAVGYYSAGQKLIQLLYVLPAIFASALFPRFAKMGGNETTDFRAATQKSLVIAMLAAAPIALGGAVLGDQIVALLFGPAYAPAGAVLRILSLTLIIVFPSIVLSNALFAAGEEKKFIPVVVIGTATNIVANYFFINLWGLPGVALATITSQLLSNWIFFHAMKQRTGFVLLPKLGRIGGAAIIMTLLAFALKVAGAPVALNIAVSGAIYALTLYILREPIIQDLKKAFA